MESVEKKARNNYKKKLKKQKVKQMRHPVFLTHLLETHTHKHTK